MHTIKDMAKGMQLRVGDQALYRFGGEDKVVDVVEDRGRLGAYGERVWRIRLTLTETEPMDVEVSERRLQPTASSLDRAQ
jgi:hypothetical protein